MTKDFNAFGGVFVPTFLSVIGVILFLRLGFIVGSAGILGTTLIILLAISVTITTGLSLSSITTNIKIGDGGAYSILRKTLGLEIGGSVGIPLYLAQVFSVGLYVFGFMEAWLFIFPEHEPSLVLLGAFITLILLIVISTNIAIKAQKLAFFLILLSLGSIFLATNPTAGLNIPLQMSADDVNFWALFALFFPATTGIMAGIGLSGRLSDPKKQIPLGVMSALVVSTIIYLATTFWFGNVADTQTLLENTDAIVTFSAIPSLVLAGILAATFSSALTTLLAAPELLSAMGVNRVVPGNKFFAKKSKGEPKNAILFTLAFIALLLILGSLDAIAPILTMFFLLTYAIINIAVYLEKSLGNVSFRPTLKIPKIVPLYGALASVFFMLMINATAAVIAIIFVITTYLILAHQNLKPQHGDARSGLFRSIATWAAEMVNKLPEGNKHNWKPSILLPVVTTRTLLGNFPVIKSIAFPNGSMTVLGLRITSRSKTPDGQEISKKQREKELNELPKLIEKFGKEHLFINSSTVDVKNYTNGICIALETIRSQVLHPNLLYLSFGPSNLPTKNLKKIFETAKKTNTGVIMLDKDSEMGLGSQQDVHVWLPKEAINQDIYDKKDYDLAMILAYRMHTNWEGELTIHIPSNKKDEEKAKRYVKKLTYEARYPQNTKIEVHTTKIEKALDKVEQSDIHLIPIKDAKDLKKFQTSKDKTILYCLDGEHEDILA